MTPGRIGQATRAATVDDNGKGRAASQHGAIVRNVLAVVWCRSVGTSWTLELRELDGNRALGSIKQWINSGVPIWQPPPDSLVRQLLAERGLRLQRDSCAGPRTRSRRGIGYAYPDARSAGLLH